jgi:hypothetical protein
LLCQRRVVEGIFFENGAVGIGVTSRPAGWFSGDIGLQCGSSDGGVVDFGNEIPSARRVHVSCARDLTGSVWVKSTALPLVSTPASVSEEETSSLVTELSTSVVALFRRHIVTNPGEAGETSLSRVIETTLPACRMCNVLARVR